MSRFSIKTPQTASTCVVFNTGVLYAKMLITNISHLFLSALKQKVSKIDIFMKESVKECGCSLMPSGHTSL
jgi:hypothetical protein